MALTSDDIKRLNAAVEASGLLNPAATAPAPSATRQNKGAVGDTFSTLGVGVSRLPGIATGIADIGAGLKGGAIRSAAQLGGASEETIGKIDSVFDRPFDRATDWVGEKTGFQPHAWGDKLQERYSPQMQAAQTATQQATQENITDRWQAGDKWGAVRGLAPTTLEYLKNPRSIQALVGESLPMTVAGGVAGGAIARGLGTTAKMVGGTATQVPRLGSAGAAGVGEGLVIAGHIMEEIDNDVDYARAALASVFGGAFGGAVGAAGATLAQRAGLIDIDAAIAGRTLSAGIREGATPRSWPVRIAGGAMFEGLQEIPQESMEEIVQNWAEGKPLFDGVLEVVAPAFLAGAAMGGGVNILKPGTSRDLLNDEMGDPSQLQKPKGTPPGSTPGAEMLKQRTTTQLEDLYQNVAKLVANAPADAEQVQRASAMMVDIKAELESRGISEAVLDLEAAQTRYAQLQMQIPAVLKTYQKAVTEAPQKLPELQKRLQAMREEFAQIHMKWGPSAQSQTAVIGRYIRTEFGDTQLGEKAFRADGRLNRGMETQLEKAKALSDEALAARVAKAADTGPSNQRELAEAAIAQIRGEPVAKLVEQYRAAPPKPVKGQAKAPPTPIDPVAERQQQVEKAFARLEQAYEAGHSVINSPEALAKAKIAAQRKLGVPDNEIQQLVTQGQPTDLAPPVTPVVAQQTPTREQQAPLAPTGEQQVAPETAPVADAKIEQVTDEVVDSGQRIEDAQFAAAALPPVQQRTYNALVQVVGELSEGRMTAGDSVIRRVADIMQQEDIAAGIADAKPRDKKTITEALTAALTAIAEGRQLNVPQRNPKFADVKLKKDLVKRRKEMETEYLLLKGAGDLNAELQKRADLREIEAEIDVRTNSLRALMNKVMGTDVDSALFEDSRDRDVSQLSDDARLDVSELTEGTGMGFRESAGQSGAGTQATSNLSALRKDLRVATAQLEQLTDIARRMERGETVTDNSGKAWTPTSLTEALQQRSNQQTALQDEINALVPQEAAVTQLAAEEQVAAQQRAEKENAWLHNKANADRTLSAVTDLDSEDGRSVGEYWDSLRRADDLTWNELASQSVFDAWAFYVGLQDIVARPRKGETTQEAVQRVYDAVATEHRKQPEGTSLASARALAEQVRKEREANVATTRPVQQAQPARAAGVRQRPDGRRRVESDGQTRPPAPETPAQAAPAAEEQVVRVTERQLIGTATKNNPFKVLRRAEARQIELREANPPVATEIIEVEGGFKLRPLPTPDPEAMVPYFNEVRALLDTITRPKLRNKWVEEFRKHEQQLPAEQLATYPEFITRLQDAIRSDAGQQAAAAARAQAEQQPAAEPEAAPGVTEETAARMDNTAELQQLDVRFYTLEQLMDQLTDDGRIADIDAVQQARDNALAVRESNDAAAFQDALDAFEQVLQEPASDVQQGVGPAVTGRTMTVSEVYEAIEDDFRDAPGIRYITHVFDDVSTLPRKVQKTIRAQEAKGNRTRGLFDPATGTIYINAQAMTTTRSVRSIVMHELGVHFALTGRMPNRMESLVHQIYRWYDSAVTKETDQWTQEEALAISAVRSVSAAARGRPQPIDEILAYFVDAAVQAGIDPTQLATVKSPALKGWLKRFVEAVNELGRRITAILSGESNLKLTAQDIVDLAYGLAQIEVSEAAYALEPSRYGRRGGEAQTGVDAIIQRMPKQTQWWWKDLQGKLMKAANVTMFSRDMVDWAVKHGLKTAKAYFNSLTEKLSIRDEKLQQLQRVVAPTAKWDYQLRGKFNEFLRMSAYREEWGFEPTWMAEHNYDPNSETAKAFQKLLRQAKTPQQAREIRTVAYKMFQHANQMHNELQAHIRKEIETSYTRLIAAAKTPAQRKQQEAERDNALREHDTKQRGFRNAYLPLRRWGEWAVVWKSPELMKAETAGDRTRIRQLKGDFNHYAVMFETSERAALRTREELQDRLRDPNGANIPDAVVAEPYPRARQQEMLNEEIPFDMINRLKQMVDLGPDVSKGVRDSVMNALDKMYISALAETSSRKSELERMSVMGANKDMIRGFIEQGTGMAALAAALDTNANTRELIGKMKNEAMERSPQRRERMMALNELLARHAQAMTYEEHPILSQTMGLTSVWMLMSNPAYYIQNSTQPFMLTYPMLAGQFGGAKSMARMVQNYPQIFKLWRATKEGGLLDPALITDLSKQQLFKDLQMRGLLDVGIAMDLGTFKDAHSGVGRIVNTVHQKMVNAVRTVELYNRGVTAMSAYELKLGQLTKGKPGQATDAQKALAREFAMDTVAVTQGDYSGVNAPRLISMIPAGRLVTQFRKFQLIQIGVLTRTLYNSFKDAKTDQEKAVRLIARRQFGYLMMMHGAVGGMLGLPIPMVMWWAVAKAFGDEDEPANIELLARREIGNKEVADLLLRGLPAYMGVNTSERLGMGMTFSLLPFVDIKPTRDGAMVAMAAALGPWTTALARSADGIGQIQQGNVLAGTAQMMPAGLMNVLRTYENHTAGVRNRRGDVLMTPEELGYLEFVTQGIGWPSKTLSDRHLIRGFEYEAKEHFKGRAEKIRRIYADAWRDGDSATMNRAIDEWVRLQEMKTNYRLGSWLPVSDLTNAPLERMKREQQTIGGVQFERTSQGFIEDMFM